MAVQFPFKGQKNEGVMNIQRRKIVRTVTKKSRVLTFLAPLKAAAAALAAALVEAEVELEPTPEPLRPGKLRGSSTSLSSANSTLGKLKLVFPIGPTTPIILPPPEPSPSRPPPAFGLFAFEVVGCRAWKCCLGSFGWSFNKASKCPRRNSCSSWTVIRDVDWFPDCTPNKHRHKKERQKTTGWRNS